MRQERHARTVVIGQRRVADMCRKKNLVFSFASVQVLPISQKPIFEARIDKHFISSRLEGFRTDGEGGRIPNYQCNRTFDMGLDQVAPVAYEDVS